MAMHKASRAWLGRIGGKYLSTLLFIAIASILGGCATMSQYAKLESPQVTLVDIKMAESTLLEQRFNVRMRLVNPNNMALPISGLNYNVKLNGVNFAKGASADTINLPALGEQVVNLSLNISSLSWLKQIRELGGSNFSGLKYELDGKLFLQGLWLDSLPFQRSGELGR